MLKEDTAIVFIECQNEFCSTDGVLFNAVKDVLEKNNVLQNIKHVMDSLRGKCHFIFVPISFHEGYPEIPRDPYGILKGVVDNNAFLKGSKGSEFFDDLKPQEGDIIAEGKRTLSAFSSSNLDTILRVNEIKKVAFTGFLTNVCVEASARSAYDLGYEVYVLSDCTATTSMEEQKFATEKILPLFSKVMKSTDFINMIRDESLLAKTKDRSYYS